MSFTQTPKSPDARFSIQRERTDSHDHFYVADYEWTVTDRRTGAIIAILQETMEASVYIGARDVRFSPDGNELIIENHDGTIERRALPAD